MPPKPTPQDLKPCDFNDECRMVLVGIVTLNLAAQSLEPGENREARIGL